MVEFWTTMRGAIGESVSRATWAEEAGFDGIAFSDTQCLGCDPYVQMALAGAATNRIRLSTSVTNPVTRHPAVMASMIATIHGETNGRAVLGIGRGDSALAHLGLAPSSVPMFAAYLERLQGYLKGEEVPFRSSADDPWSGLKSVEDLGIGKTPSGGSLHWLPQHLPKVPVFVAATGPRVIATGARLADRIMFTVGSEASRIQWAMDVARQAMTDSGRPTNDQPTLGAYIPIVVNEDRETARRVIAGKASVYARFSVMHGQVVGPTTGDTDQTLLRMNAAYDMGEHSTSGSSQSKILDPESIDKFAVAGPPDYCIERIQAILDLGLSTIFLTGPLTDTDPAEEAHSRELFASEVLPALSGG